MMLKAGCSLEHANRKGQTALQEAVRISSPEATNTLLVYGANSNRKNDAGQHVFSYAVYCGSVAAVEAMLAEPVTPPRICSKEWLAFYMGKTSKRPGEESDTEEEEEQVEEVAEDWYEEEECQKFEERLLVFLPGEPGFTVDDESGLVNSVEEDGKADQLGVKVDWRIVSLQPVTIGLEANDGEAPDGEAAEDEAADKEENNVEV